MKWNKPIGFCHDMRYDWVCTFSLIWIETKKETKESKKGGESDANFYLRAIPSDIGQLKWLKLNASEKSDGNLSVSAWINMGGISECNFTMYMNHSSQNDNYYSFAVEKENPEISQTISIAFLSRTWRSKSLHAWHVWLYTINRVNTWPLSWPIASIVEFSSRAQSYRSRTKEHGMPKQYLSTRSKNYTRSNIQTQHTENVKCQTVCWQDRNQTLFAEVFFSFVHSFAVQNLFSAINICIRPLFDTNLHNVLLNTMQIMLVIFL